VASSAAENPRSRPRSINYWQIPAEEVGNYSQPLREMDSIGAALAPSLSRGMKQRFVDSGAIFAPRDIAAG
jgi:hypothetical protein